MASLFTKHLPTLVAEKYYIMKKLTSKLQRTDTDIGFNKKAIHHKGI